MRAVAVVAVMLGHLFLSRLQNGQVGVDVFFVLSGFLITWLLIAEHDRGNGVSFRAFYARRALRLFPALAAVLIVVTLVVITWSRLSGFKSATLTELPWAILYVGNYNFVDLGRSDLLSHTWSLAVEEQFYLIWPVICVTILKYKLNKIQVAESLLTVALIEAIARWIYLRHLNGDVQVSYHALFLRSDGLLVGCAIAFAFASGLGEHLAGPMFNTLVKLAALAGVVLFLGVVWGEPQVLTNQWVYIPLTVMASAAVLTSLLVAPFGPLEAMLSSRPVVWIGRRSYGVYLWHWPIFRVFSTVVYRDKMEQAAIIFSEFTLTFVLVAASWRFVEKPALRLKERFQRT